MTGTIIFVSSYQFYEDWIEFFSLFELYSLWNGVDANIRPMRASISIIEDDAIEFCIEPFADDTPREEGITDRECSS